LPPSATRLYPSKGEILSVKSSCIRQPLMSSIFFLGEFLQPIKKKKEGAKGTKGSFWEK
jgi:hypothetical protein